MYLIFKIGLTFIVYKIISIIVERLRIKGDGVEVLGLGWFQALKWLKEPKLLEDQLTKLSGKCGVSFNQLILPCYYLNTPETIKSALTNQSIGKTTKSLKNDKFRKFGGKNVAIVEGSFWKHSRLLMSPAFNQLSQFTPIFHECYSQLKKKIDIVLDEVKENEEFEVQEIITRFSFECLATTGWNIKDFREMVEEKPEFYELYERLLEGWLDPLLIQGFVKYWPFTQIKKVKEINRSMDYIGECAKILIDKEVARQKQDDYKKPDEKEQGFLSVMVERYLKDEKDWSYENVRANVGVSLLAGLDTTISSMSQMLEQLGNDKALQSKLRDDIIKTFGDKRLDSTTMNDSPFLSGCIFEGLRLFPPAVSVPLREVKRDTTISGENGKEYKLRKGHFVAYNSMLGADDKYFPNAKEFKPERWNDINSSGNFVFNTFGNGKHVCLGRAFALLEQKIFLTNFLRDYEVQSATIERGPVFALRKISKVSLSLKKLN